jgi:hypothetical protein
MPPVIPMPDPLADGDRVLDNFGQHNVAENWRRGPVQEYTDDRYSPV